MDLGLHGCVSLAVNKGKLIKSDGIGMSGRNNLRNLAFNRSPKQIILFMVIKAIVTKKCIRRVRKVLKSKLNITKSIHKWPSPYLQFSAGIRHKLN